MLYWLYLQLEAHHIVVPGLNLLRYLTFRGGMAVATSQLVVVAMGSRFIRWMQAKQGKGQPIRVRRHRPPHHRKGRNADHGRLDVPGRHHRRHPAVGRPQQHLRVGGADGHPGVRRARLHGRLRQGHQTDHGRDLGTHEAGCRGRRRDSGGVSDDPLRAGLAGGRSPRHLPDLPDLQGRRAGPVLAVSDLRRPGDRRRLERGELHRRTRWPGHGAGDDRLGDLRPDHLSGRQLSCSPAICSCTSCPASANWR